MQKRKTIILSLLVATLLLVMFSMVMATTTLNSPAAGSNNTGTINVTCTTTLNASSNSYNTTFYYNASGGAATTGATVLVTVKNTSAMQGVFTSATQSISALTDGTNYNMSCYANNNSNNEYSAGRIITIDNTDPTYTFSLSKVDRADLKGTQYFTWTTTDATSGVQTVSVTSTSPNADRCPTQTWTTTSGTQTKVNLDCTGTYTAALTVTDYAGNSDTKSDTFKVYAPGEKEITTDGQSFGTFSILGDSEEAKGNLKSIIVIILIILIAWAVTKK